MRIPVYAPGKGNEEIAGFALVDATDLDYLSEFLWRINKDGYACRRSGGREVLMHREVLGLTSGDSLCTDHINRNKLDNRRMNLRCVTRQENAQNRGPTPAKGDSSPYRGVFWDKRGKKWVAFAHLNRRRYTLGSYQDELEAARVASEWRTQHMPFSVEA